MPAVRAFAAPEAVFLWLEVWRGGICLAVRPCVATASVGGSPGVATCLPICVGINLVLKYAEFGGKGAGVGSRGVVVVVGLGGINYYHPQQVLQPGGAQRGPCKNLGTRGTSR
jgi:hypothetical protein